MTPETWMSGFYRFVWYWMALIPSLLTCVNYLFLRPIDTRSWSLWKIYGFYGAFLDGVTYLFFVSLAHALAAFCTAELSYTLLEKSLKRSPKAFECRQWEVRGMIFFPLLIIWLHHGLNLAKESKLIVYLTYPTVPIASVFFLPYGYFAGWVLWETVQLFKPKKRTTNRS